MEFDAELLKLDYLVFSAHKSATQSVVSTLTTNGFRCTHCHVLRNIGIEKGAFQDFLVQYYAANQKKLGVITTFREPIQRHISSFFQWYAEGVITRRGVPGITDTIIYSTPIKELQSRIIREIEAPPADRVEQAEESLQLICNELHTSVGDLRYSAEKHYGLHETDTCQVFIFRFDVLTKNLESLLAAITGKPITEHSVNLSTAKWYNDIYTECRASLKIPRALIQKVYQTKRDLIELVYAAEYDSLLAATLERYGE